MHHLWCTLRLFNLRFHPCNHPPNQGADPSQPPRRLPQPPEMRTPLISIVGRCFCLWLNVIVIIIVDADYLPCTVQLSHFPDDETEAQRGKVLPEVAFPVMTEPHRAAGWSPHFANAGAHVVLAWSCNIHIHTYPCKTVSSH